MIELYQVDAFTQTPFKGNPAGVCLLPDQKPDAWMLDLAAEMNLSETAFLLRQSGGYALRWFTPKTEVSLCGHATLASAHILFQQGIEPEGQAIDFFTRSGTLRARKDGQLIELDFPSHDVQAAAPLADLKEALGVDPVFTGRYQREKGDTYLLELDSEAAVRRLDPDYGRLAASAARTVITTARSSDPAYDFVSRFFAPAIGIDEDPVTGSAHCYLAPYWGRKLGKQEMTGYQVSRRTGVLRCRWQADRVLLGGTAVTVFRATLMV